MNASRRLTLVLILHWLAPMRSSFAFWGKRPGLCPVQHTKTRGLPTRYGRPSREMLAESAGILRPASKQRLKSP